MIIRIIRRWHVGESRTSASISGATRADLVWNCSGVTHLLLYADSGEVRQNSVKTRVGLNH